MTKAFAPGERVVLRRPRVLAGLIATVLRQTHRGVEVQFFGNGTPYSFVARRRHLEPLAPAPASQTQALREHAETGGGSSRFARRVPAKRG